MGDAPPLRGIAMLAACLTTLALVACGHSTHANAQAVPAAHPAGVRTESIEVGGMRRTFLLDVPAGRTPMPLVLVYHGDQQTAVETETGDWNGVAGQEHEIVAFLQGVDDTWNAGLNDNAAGNAGADDLAFTRAVLRRIEARYRVDKTRVAAVGFSDGAFLTDLIGCRLAGQVRLIMPMEGELPSSVSPNCRPSRPVSVYEVHATADPFVPYSGGHIDGDPTAPTVLSAPAAVARWAALDHCTAGPSSTNRGASTLKTWARCARGARVTLDTIHGGRHDWPPTVGEIVASALSLAG
jgi:polyhydroxybutyrate depolymerase